MRLCVCAACEAADCRSEEVGRVLFVDLTALQLAVSQEKRAAMGEDVSPVMMAVLIVTNVALAVAFGVPALVIGVRYSDPAVQTCGFTSTPPLWTWLIVYGSTVLCFAVVSSAALLLVNRWKAIFAVVSLVTGCFNLAWNIVGAVALFRDSPFCNELVYPLWAMTLACLIITWISMFFSCFAGYRIKS